MHYLSRAYASAEETVEHLRLLPDTNSSQGLRRECEELVARYDELARKLFKYVNAVRAQHDPGRALHADQSTPYADELRWLLTKCSTQTETLRTSRTLAAGHTKGRWIRPGRCRRNRCDEGARPSRNRPS